MVCPSCGAENPVGAEVCFHCRFVLSAVTRGTLLAGRYEILEPLGRGGMGLVFKAHDRRLDETVAIKVLRPESALQSDSVERIVDEIKLARRVSHRNVCRIYEFGEDAGRSFIAMEYVDGVDLKQLVRSKGGLPRDEAFSVAQQVAAGLEAIHEAGIIHRDLKTANIMRDGRGVVRLMDFGIAKQIVTGTTDVSTGRLVGTPEYMSPEQFTGEKVDFRSDVYALGIVVFELFTGEVPFKGDSPLALLHMHLNEQPTLDSAVASKLPPNLVPVLRHALARKPAERYASVAEMRDALTRVEAGGSARRLPDTSPLASRWGIPALRSRTVRWGALAAVLAFGVGLGLALRLGRGDEVPPRGVGLEGPGAAGREAPPAWPGPDDSAVTEGPFEAPVELAPEGPEAGPATTQGQTPAPGSAAGSSGQVVNKRGWLRLDVVPWADVSVNGVRRGRTPLPPLELAPGRHVVVLTHPRYKSIQRKVTINAGEVVPLEVDFGILGIPR